MQIGLLALISIINSVTAIETIRPCRRIETFYGFNCECTEDYCDTLDIPEPENENQFVVVTSSQGGDRFSYEYQAFNPLISIAKLEPNSLWINQLIKYSQSEIVGFGGGHTGASSFILSQFSPKLRRFFVESYFSPKHGIGYNMLRIPIGGTDFDFEQWAYDDVQSENDTNLLQFNALHEHDKVRNVQIKEMQEIANSSEIKVLAAAWTPPRWMKARQQWYGKEDNRLLPEFYQTWADYHVKWIKLMSNDGVPIWGVSSGNEVSACFHTCSRGRGFRVLTHFSL